MRQRPSVGGARWALIGGVVATLAAFAVRVYGLSDLHLTGDSAYSVQVAGQSLAALTASRIFDGHPPLVYYLLYVWLRLAGTTELSARLLPVFMGALLVPVMCRLARALAGSPAALAVAWLIALSPDLALYSRQARMYSLFPLAVAASWLLLSRAIRRPGRVWFAYSAVTAVALYSHYYALMAAAAQGIYLLARCHGAPRRAGLGSLALAGAVFLPWALWVGPTQARTTAGIISNEPPAVGLLGFAEQLWLPFQAGMLVDLGLSRLLGLVAALVLLAAAVSSRCWRSRAGAGATLDLPLAATLLPIGFSLGLFIVGPIAVRPRFLLVALPFYLATLGILLASARPRPLAALLLLAILAGDGYALSQSYPVERTVLEADALQLADHLDRWTRPGDVVVFQAAWEIGYLRAHRPNLPATLIGLNELPPAFPAALGNPRRIWLAAYKASPHELPPGADLEHRWRRAAEWKMPPTTLALYVAPPVEPAPIAPVRFVERNGRPGLTLVGAVMDGAVVPAGEDVAFRLGWLAEAPPSGRYTAFVHLDALSGQGLAGDDVEPGRESHPTQTWSAGEHIVDAHALRVPLDAPSGEYDVVVGLYQFGGGPRLHVAGQPDQTTVWIGRLRVAPPVVRPAHSPVAPLGATLVVTGVTTDLDRFAIGEQREIPILSNQALPVVVARSAYRPGETADVEVHWRAVSRPLESLAISLRAVGPAGTVLTAPAARPLSGPAGVSLFHLTWPADVAAGTYRLFVATGATGEDVSPQVGEVRVGR